MADQYQQIPLRPPTPQTLIHRLPDKPDPSFEDSSPRRPAKHIILIMGSTAVAGKVQIATTVAQALACPLYQGDSLHESSAKAASLGGGTSQNQISGGLPPPPNEQRYKRMWLSKMTRTGLLFPEASRPANEGSGSGTVSPHVSSAASSRRGSAASDATSNASSAGAWGSTVTTATQYMNKPVFAEPDPAARERRANPALLVLTHPQLEGWHRAAIRESIGEYGIGVVFVPLYRDADDANEEDAEGDLPVLKPLDPSTMTSFGSFGQSAVLSRPAGLSLDEEFVLKVDVEKQIEDLIQEIIEGVRDVMNVT